MSVLKYARWLGILLQALALGIGLYYAVGRLVGIDTTERLFRYQAF